MIENINIVDGPQLFEAALWHDDTISLDVEDGTSAVSPRYSLDEIRTIVASLGHLLWLADNQN